jgi:hypothetical protein
VADFASPGSNSDGIAFLVAAGIVYEIIAAACSSPQTAEINAHSRADTLMKWVRLGMLQAAGFVFIAAWIDKAHRTAIVAGGATAAGLMWWQYDHAMKSGLASGEPGTETY